MKTYITNEFAITKRSENNKEQFLLYRKNVSKNLKRFRKIRGWTQEQLAEGVCRQCIISKCEAGIELPKFVTLVNIAKKIKIPIYALYEADPSILLPTIKIEETPLIEDPIMWIYLLIGAMAILIIIIWFWFSKQK